MNSAADNKYSFLPQTFFVAFLLLLAACLRWHEMDRALGGADENAMLLYFGYAPFKYIATTYYDANNHIFHTLLVHWMSLGFGEENAIALRFPSFVFGMACLFMIYLVALQIFHSRPVAWAALLIAAINSIHIHYSQTARGYSLIMFFSIAMVYAAIKLLDFGPSWRWGGFLVICGVLSVYTLPTNVFFLVGLGAWVICVLGIPSLRNEFNSDLEWRRRQWFLLAGSTGVIAVFCFFLYLPVYDQMIDTAQKHPLLTVDSESTSLTHLIPAVLFKIWEGPAGWFLPFLLAGLFWGTVVRRSFRLLLPIVFVLPFLMTQVTGVGGYPRNYLFNLPLLVIFMAAGIVQTARWLADHFNKKTVEKFFTAGILSLFTLISLKILFLDYYPSLKISDGNNYKQAVKNNTSPLDFILIADSKNYLYARSVFKENIQNIIEQNKLAGLKIITPHSMTLGDFQLPSAKVMWPIFKNLVDPKNLNTQNVTGGKKIISVSGPNPIPLLPEDFEANFNWEILAGDGNMSLENEHIIAGENSIRLRANPKKDLIVRATVPGIVHIDRPQLMLLTWVRKNVNPQAMSYHPVVGARVNINGMEKYIQFMMGMVNDGINFQLKGQTKEMFPYYWHFNSSLGLVMPGSFSFNIALKCKEGESVLYDGFRLFLIDLPEG